MLKLLICIGDDKIKDVDDKSSLVDNMSSISVTIKFFRILEFLNKFDTDKKVSKMTLNARFLIGFPANKSASI